MLLTEAAMPTILGTSNSSSQGECSALSETPSIDVFESFKHEWVSSIISKVKQARGNAAVSCLLRHVAGAWLL
jgi:hypothetical protein